MSVIFNTMQMSSSQRSVLNKVLQSIEEECNELFEKYNVLKKSIEANPGGVSILYCNQHVQVEFVFDWRELDILTAYISCVSKHRKEKDENIIEKYDIELLSYLMNRDNNHHIKTFIFSSIGLWSKVFRLKIRRIVKLISPFTDQIFHGDCEIFEKALENKKRRRN